MKKANFISKKELVKIVAEKTGTTGTAKYIDAVFEAIEEVLSEGCEIRIKGFGSFKPAAVAERKGRDPRTQEEITIPAHKKITFKPGKSFKAKVNVL